MDSNHSTDPLVDFTVVYTIRTNQPIFLRIQLLKTTEALTVYELKPELCVQKSKSYRYGYLGLHLLLLQ